MAVAAEIQYFLQSASEMSHIANDVYYFFHWTYPDTNAFIDAYPRDQRKGRTYRYGKHMDTLRDMGAYCEERYLAFRRDNREMTLGASHYHVETAGGQFCSFIDEYSVQMVNRGHQRLTDRAMEQAHRDYGLFDNLAVMKRACVRSYHDSHGYDPAFTARALEIANAQYDAYRQSELVQLQELRRVLGRQEVEVNERNKRRAAAYIRSQVAKDRKVVKRSVRAAERFLGAHKTRLFVGGKEMRITGRYATYVVEKTGGILSSHSGARLSVYTKEGDIFLCNLCIYTDKVPLLDHVISLLLHIKSGHEEDILARGNAFNVKEAAYDQDWLTPHLPQRVEPGRMAGARQIRIPAGALYEVYREPDRQDRIDVLRREIAEWLFAEIGEYCPPMPFTREVLLSGLDERRYAVTQAGQEALGIDRLPTNVEMAGLYDEFVGQGLGGQRIVEAPVYDVWLRPDTPELRAEIDDMERRRDERGVIPSGA